MCRAVPAVVGVAGGGPQALPGVARAEEAGTIASSPMEVDARPPSSAATDASMPGTPDGAAARADGGSGQRDGHQHEGQQQNGGRRGCGSPGEAGAMDLRSPTHIGGPLPAKKRMHWEALRQEAEGEHSWFSERFHQLTGNGQDAGDTKPTSTSERNAGCKEDEDAEGAELPRPWSTPTLKSALAAGRRERERVLGRRAPATGIESGMADMPSAVRSPKRPRTQQQQQVTPREVKREEPASPEPTPEELAAKAAREKALAEKRAKAEAAAKAAKAARQAERERKQAAAQAAAARRAEQRRIEREEREKRKAAERERAAKAREANGRDGSEAGQAATPPGDENLDDAEVARRLHAELNASPRIAAPRRTRRSAPVPAPAPIQRQRTAPVSTAKPPQAPTSLVARQLSAPPLKGESSPLAKRSNGAEVRAERVLPSKMSDAQTPSSSGSPAVVHVVTKPTGTAGEVTKASAGDANGGAGGGSGNADK